MFAGAPRGLSATLYNAGVRNSSMASLVAQLFHTHTIFFTVNDTMGSFINTVCRLTGRQEAGLCTNEPATMLFLMLQQFPDSILMSCR
jgi:hypothetical protein